MASGLNRRRHCTMDWTIAGSPIPRTISRPHYARDVCQEQRKGDSRSPKLRRGGTCGRAVTQDQDPWSGHLRGVRGIHHRRMKTSVEPAGELSGEVRDILTMRGPTGRSELLGASLITLLAVVQLLTLADASGVSGSFPMK